MLGLVRLHRHRDLTRTYCIAVFGIHYLFIFFLIVYIDKKLVVWGIWCIG